MGTNQAHHTTRVPTDDINVLRTRLKRDLSVIDGVTSVRDETVARNGIVFETDGKDIEPEMMRVLADHDTILPTEQPTDTRTHSALIKTRNLE